MPRFKALMVDSAGNEFEAFTEASHITEAFHNLQDENPGSEVGYVHETGSQSPTRGD